MCEVWAARSARAAKRGSSGSGSQGLGLPSSWPDLPPELVALVFAGLRPRDLRRGALLADYAAVLFSLTCVWPALLPCCLLAKPLKRGRRTLTKW